jgi:hypothetical protein
MTPSKTPAEILDIAGLIAEHSAAARRLVNG